MDKHSHELDVAQESCFCLRAHKHECHFAQQVKQHKRVLIVDLHPSVKIFWSFIQLYRFDWNIFTKEIFTGIYIRFKLPRLCSYYTHSCANFILALHPFVKMCWSFIQLCRFNWKSVYQIHLQIFWSFIQLLSTRLFIIPWWITFLLSN